MDTSLFVEYDFGIKYGKTYFTSQRNYVLKLDYLVILYNIKGTINLYINFKEYTITSANIVVLSSDDIVIINDTSADFETNCFSINKIFASQIAFDLPNKLFSYLHHFPVQYLKKEQLIQLNYWHLQGMYILNQDTTYQVRMLCNIFQNLFLIIAHHSSLTNFKTDLKFTRKEELCWKFWDLVGTYSKTHRDVAFYAEKLNITPYYLAQIAKNYLNDIPKDLINRQVILHIKALLKSTNLSISQIAQELNFEDPSYMGKYFKRETGLSMMEFKKKKI